MNEIDRNILSAIQIDGRASYADIGKQVGLSVSAVNDRLKKLQSAGALKNWSAEIDPKSVGLDVLAFVYVLIERTEYNSGFMAAVQEMPEIQECHHVTGEWSYMLKIRAGSVQALEEIITERIKGRPGVSRSHTQIALSSPKETVALPIPVS